MKTGKQDLEGKQSLDKIYGDVSSACFSRTHPQEPYAITHRDKGYVSLDNLMPNQRARWQLQLADSEIKVYIIPLAKNRGIKLDDRLTGKQMLNLVYRIMSLEDHVTKKRDSRGSYPFRMLDEWCGDEAHIMADRSDRVFVWED